VESGARNVDNILSNTMLPEVSRLLLETMAAGGAPGTVNVGVDDAGDLTYDATPAVRDAGYSLGAPGGSLAAPAAAGGG
jgi:type VI secretion system protein VasG